MHTSTHLNSGYTHTQYTLFHLSSLKISEHTLKEVAEQQGSDLQSIAALVKENEEILDQMKACYYNVIDTFLFSFSHRQPFFN